MKKKIAFIMAVIMCGSMFTACGKDDESSSSGKKKEKASVTETVDEEDEEDSEEEETESKSKKSKSTTEAEEDDDDEEETESKTKKSKSATEAEEDDDEDETSGKKIKLPGKKNGEEDTEAATVKKAEAVENFKRGKNKNGVYTSEFAGLKFEVPDGWKCADEEEILNMMNLALDVTGNEEILNSELTEQASIYELYAKGEGGKNVMIAYENLDVSTAMEGASEYIDEEMYVENMKDKLEEVVGVTYTDLSDAKKVELAGQDFYKYTQTATYDSMGGYTVKQTYYIKKYGKLMMFIVFTSSTECEDMSVYEKNFSAL